MELENVVEAGNSDGKESIDRAIAAARARREAKEAAARTSGLDEAVSLTSGGSTVKRSRLSDEERRNRQDAIEQRKAEREARRQEREREKSSRPAHMTKVEKIGASLPPLDGPTTSAFEHVKSLGLTDAQLSILCSHVQHDVRVRSTLSSLGKKIEEGSRVRVVSCEANPRLIGVEGVVTKSNKIRVHVKSDSTDKVLYLFTSDVEVVS